MSLPAPRWQQHLLGALIWLSVSCQLSLHLRKSPLRWNFSARWEMYLWWSVILVSSPIFRLFFSCLSISSVRVGGAFRVLSEYLHLIPHFGCLLGPGLHLTFHSQVDAGICALSWDSLLSANFIITIFFLVLCCGNNGKNEDSSIVLSCCLEISSWHLFPYL